LKRKIVCLLVLLYAVFFIGCNEKENSVHPQLSDDYQRGMELTDTNNDSAFYYFNKVATTSEDSLEIAMAYNKMGIIQFYSGDYFGSQESLLLSLTYLNEKKSTDYYCLLSTYNELGRTSQKLKNYDAAIEYYDKALRFTDNEMFKAIALNNKANTYQERKQYDEALSIYERILGQSKDDKRGYARVLSNMTKVRWLRDSSYNALPDLWTAKQIRTDEKDLWGLSASYAHLSDYYEKNNRDSSLDYALKMYQTVHQLESPYDELEALQRLIVISSAATKNNYFNRYLHLSDSLQIARNNSRNQFAIIRYETEKAKADNLTLLADNANKKLRIIYLQIFFGIAAISAIMIFIWYRKRKKQAIREQKLATSQRVHDVVANGIYRLISMIEHGLLNDKEKLLDYLDILYKQSRDISYEQSTVKSDSGQNHVVSILKDFSSSGVNVEVLGDIKEVWSVLAVNEREELGKILQELMVNMSKHSSASNVKIIFERKPDEVSIYYSDNGIGMPTDLKYGNGLSNTENRIKKLNGRINFVSEPLRGLDINIYIPIH
jgi:tetratricopeptide (TPR) repeat protein